jgi:DNA-binding transcriptional regulator LsrR (DeoR family)
MVKTLHPPLVYPLKQDKSSNKNSQFAQTFEGFFNQPLTMMELSVITGIDRANICRYCAVLRAAGSIAIYKKGYCSITKHLANQYTTNPQLFPIDLQGKLF